MKELLHQANAMKERLISVRRALHACAEVGFDTPMTKEIIKDGLQAVGLKAKPCGNSLVVELGRGKKTFLLRADMDGLPVKEETGLSFACKKGKMHACGHDLHATMLLGAASLLKEREEELSGKVRFLFQPAEELLKGAKDALEHGAADGVDGAMMIHALTDIPLPAGTAVVASGTSAPAADYFQITVKGKGCHGSAPWNGVDALNAAAHTVVALNALSAREISLENPAVLTVGRMQAGTAGNVIADRAEVNGTLRAFEEGTRERLKKRLGEIAKGTATAFGAKAKVTFGGGCPTLVNDEGLTRLAVDTFKAGLGKDRAFSSVELSGDAKAKSGGSEDFAYISHAVPSVMVALAAGEPSKGYRYPLHHPKASFDESALPIGAFLYASMALAFFKQ